MSEETSPSIYGHLPSRPEIHTDCSNLNQMLSTNKTGRVTTFRPRSNIRSIPCRKGLIQWIPWLFELSLVVQYVEIIEHKYPRRKVRHLSKEQVYRWVIGLCVDVVRAWETSRTWTRMECFILLDPSSLRDSLVKATQDPPFICCSMEATGSHAGSKAVSSSM